MKKIILLIVCIVFLPLSVMADNSVLNSIENTVFGIEYKKETDLQRVERIERYLYGSKKTGNLQARIKTIQDDIGYSEPVVQKPKQQQQSQPQAQKPADVKNNMAPSVSNEVMNMKEDASVDYPIVDKMEQEVFKTTYKNENIYKRLDRLEEQVFKKKSNASLNDRVNKLADVIKPVKTARMPEQTSYNDPYADFFQDQNNIGKVNDQSMVFHLAALEQELLNANYSNDNISSRLSRLEQKLFNKTYTSDSDTARMQRLLVAYNAKRSSYKYDSNHKMQNMATMSQIGGILLMILAMLL